MSETMKRQTPCISCGAPLLWVRTEAGNWMPLDPQPIFRGNIKLNKGIAYYQTKEEVHEADALLLPTLYLSHFATCPNAKKHRKPKE